MTRNTITTALALLLIGWTPLPGMVVVPAGPAVLGDDAGFPDETPRRTVEVPAFAIDKLEVSNADYERFLEADPAARKDATPRYWKRYVPPLVRDGPVGKLLRFGPQTFRKPDHPVVGVDWFSARAYCAWAGKRLPTEAQWEKAARGTDGRTWPWGALWRFDRANSGGYERAGERDGHMYTAAVSAYPGAASPYGALNMAGNVWEWTSSAYESRPDAPELWSRGGPPDGVQRVIKGGSFRSYPSSVRPARRGHYEPGYKSFDIGFRCAVDAP